MSRVQLALNVADLEASVAFYSAMFGVEPHKLRPGYANFAIEDPALKLVLIEVGDAARGHGTSGALNHLGVEVPDGAAVAAARDRFAAAGLASFDENDTTCCYALQDKVWVHDPAGAPWEVYTIKDDQPADASPPTSGTQAAHTAQGSHGTQGTEDAVEGAAGCCGADAAATPCCASAVGA